MYDLAHFVISSSFSIFPFWPFFVESVLLAFSVSAISLRSADIAIYNDYMIIVRYTSKLVYISV